MIENINFLRPQDVDTCDITTSFFTSKQPNLTNGPSRDSFRMEYSHFGATVDESDSVDIMLKQRYIKCNHQHSYCISLAMRLEQLLR